jgi:hypothetical protein
MADLGAVGRPIPGCADTALGPMSFIAMPTYASSTVSASAPIGAFRVDGVFGGNAKVAGVNTANVEVFVLWRPTLQRIARVRTDADGNWSFTGLNPDQYENYVVVFKDPPGGTAYNDAIYSLAVPAT